MDIVKSIADIAMALVKSIDWGWVAPSVAGGVSDYLTKPSKQTVWQWIVGLFVHLVIALFVGWFAGTYAGVLGYGDDVRMLAAAGGSFLGVRVTDIAIYMINRHIGKKP